MENPERKHRILLKYCPDIEILKFTLLLWDEIVIWPSTLNDLLKEDFPDFLILLQMGNIKFQSENLTQEIQDKIYYNIPTEVYDFISKNGKKISFPKSRLSRDLKDTAVSFYQRMIKNKFLREIIKNHNATNVRKEWNPVPNFFEGYSDDFLKEIYEKFETRFIERAIEHQSANLFISENEFTSIVQDLITFPVLRSSQEEFVKFLYYFHNIQNSEQKETINSSQIDNSLFIQIPVPRISMVELQTIQKKQKYQSLTQDLFRVFKFLYQKQNTPRQNIEKDLTLKISRILKQLSQFQNSFEGRSIKFGIKVKPLQGSNLFNIIRSQVEWNSTLFIDFEW